MSASIPISASLLLPRHCYNADKTIFPEGAVVHFVSVDIDNPNMNPGLTEHDRFDPEKVALLLQELNKPASERGQLLKKGEPGAARNYASYHFLVDRQGVAYCLVPPMFKAYHAGRSRFRSRDNCNVWTLGLGLIATAESGYTAPQYITASILCKMFDIPSDMVAGHDDVRAAWLSAHPGTDSPKHDPGELFDWSHFNALF